MGIGPIPPRGTADPWTRLVWVSIRQQSKRLTLLLIRRDGQLVETLGLGADFVATRCARSNTARDDSVAGLITARCTNEDIFSSEADAAGIGTNQIDSTVRYGQANFLDAMRRIGLGGLMNTSEEITKANAILVIALTSQTHPLTGCGSRRRCADTRRRLSWRTR